MSIPELWIQVLTEFTILKHLGKLVDIFCWHSNILGGEREGCREGEREGEREGGTEGGKRGRGVLNDNTCSISLDSWTR